MSLISLSVQRQIIPHIRSCTDAREAWLTLERLYAARHEAKISFLKRELDHLEMKTHLNRIQDLREQLINIDEVIPEMQLVQTALSSLPPSYLSFHTSLNLSLRNAAQPLSFQELVSLLLQEEQV